MPLSYVSTPPKDNSSIHLNRMTLLSPVHPKRMILLDIQLAQRGWLYGILSLSKEDGSTGYPVSPKRMALWDPQSIQRGWLSWITSPSKVDDSPGFVSIQRGWLSWAYTVNFLCLTHSFSAVRQTLTILHICKLTYK